MTGKTFTPEHFHRIERLLCLLDAGMISEQAAAETGIPVSTVANYRSSKRCTRRKHEQRRLIRKAYAAGRSVRWLARDFRCDPRSIATLVADIARACPRKAEPERIIVTKFKQVIVETVDANGVSQVVLVTPTGRREFCTSAQHPERQWMFEALDSRDGYAKMFAMTDIRQWIGEPEKSLAEAA